MGDRTSVMLIWDILKLTQVFTSQNKFLTIYVCTRTFFSPDLWIKFQISRKHCLYNFNYTCDKQVLWESAGAFFSARQLSDFTRQLARFTRSWSSGKMLAFQPRGFVFEPVGMR